MCPDERKMIEEWTKKAEFNAEDMKVAMDMEMKMKLGKDKEEKKWMIVSGQNSELSDILAVIIHLFFPVHGLPSLGQKQANV